MTLGWETIFGFFLTACGLIFTWYQFSKRINEDKGAQKEKIEGLEKDMDKLTSQKIVSEERCAGFRATCPLSNSMGSVEKKITALCIQLDKAEERRVKWEEKTEGLYLDLIKSINRHMGKTEEFMRGAMETMNSNKKSIEHLSKEIGK